MDRSKFQIEETYRNRWAHRWGIPSAHAAFWTIGLFVTTDLLGVLKCWFNTDSYGLMAFSLGTVIVIFFGEIALSFIDVLYAQEIKTLNVTICRFFALLVTVLVVVVVLMFLGCYFLPRCPDIGESLIALLIFISAFAKGTEIWLQNNWDRFAVDVPATNQPNELSYTTLD